MRILLTRAAADAARTRVALEELGHKVMVSPVITIEATGASWPGGTVDGVLATSRQAFEVIESGWGPNPEMRRVVPLWLVGRRTEDAARSRGFAGASFVAPNAATLARRLITLCDASKRIVYLAGRDRKPDIEAELAASSLTVAILENYEARASASLQEAALKALTTGTLDAVAHFSRRSATLFVVLTDGCSLAPRITHHCLSEDVAEPLAKRGWPTKVADQPTERQLIATFAAATCPT